MLIKLSSTGQTAVKRTFVIKGNQYSYVVTARATLYIGFDNVETWGKTTFSAVLFHSGEAITPAKCGKSNLISQLNVIDNSPVGMFK